VSLIFFLSSHAPIPSPPNWSIFFYFLLFSSYFLLFSSIFFYFLRFSSIFFEFLVHFLIHFFISGGHYTTTYPSLSTYSMPSNENKNIHPGVVVLRAGVRFDLCFPHFWGFLKFKFRHLFLIFYSSFLIFYSYLLIFFSSFSHLYSSFSHILPFIQISLLPHDNGANSFSEFHWSTHEDISGS